MPIQTPQIQKPLSTKIASIEIAVPRSLSGDVRRCWSVIIVPADLLVRKDVVGIYLLAIAIYFLAIDTGCAAA